MNRFLALMPSFGSTTPSSSTADSTVSVVASAPNTGIDIIRELEQAKRIQDAVYLPAWRATIRCGGSLKESADTISAVRHAYPPEVVEEAAERHALFYLEIVRMKAIMDFSVKQLDCIHATCSECLASLQSGQKGQQAFLDLGATNRLKHTESAVQIIKTNVEQMRGLTKCIRIGKLQKHVDTFIGSCIPATHKDSGMSAPSYAEQFLVFKNLACHQLPELTIDNFEEHIPQSLLQAGPTEVILESDSTKLGGLITQLTRLKPKVEDEDDWKQTHVSYDSLSASPRSQQPPPAPPGSFSVPLEESEEDDLSEHELALQPSNSSTALASQPAASTPPTPHSSPAPHSGSAPTVLPSAPASAAAAAPTPSVSVAAAQPANKPKPPTGKPPASAAEATANAAKKKPNGAGGTGNQNH